MKPTFHHLPVTDEEDYPEPEFLNILKCNSAEKCRYRVSV
jgi:hypothetical protein